jgi:hypothetical protein|eukprot:jgi/Chrpa1/19488/Chrysochromulina_OHIO_Genome00007538-RA
MAEREREMSTVAAREMAVRGREVEAMEAGETPRVGGKPRLVVTSPAAAKRAQEGVEGRPDSACCPSRVLPAAQQAQTD